MKLSSIILFLFIMVMPTIAHADMLPTPAIDRCLFFCTDCSKKTISSSKSCRGYCSGFSVNQVCKFEKTLHTSKDDCKKLFDKCRCYSTIDSKHIPHDDPRCKSNNDEESFTIAIMVDDLTDLQQNKVEWCEYQYALYELCEGKYEDPIIQNNSNVKPPTTNPELTSSNPFLTLPEPASEPLAESQHREPPALPSTVEPQNKHTSCETALSSPLIPNAIIILLTTLFGIFGLRRLRRSNGSQR